MVSFLKDRLQWFGFVVVLLVVLGLVGGSLGYADPIEDFAGGSVVQTYGDGTRLPADVIKLPKRELPADPYREWDGKAGVPVGVQAVLDDPDYFRVALLSVQRFVEVGEPEVREVALAALVNPTVEGLDQASFVDIPAAKKKAEERIAGEQKKAREQLEAWRASGEGGEVFKAQLKAALDSTDPRAWTDFVLWGAAGSRAWDEKFAILEADRKEVLRGRLLLLSGLGGVVAEQSKALLESGTDAQIAEFF